MKRKRLLAAGLSLVLSLSLTAAPVSAAAADFPDIENHWAKDYIEEMVQVGLFNGYEDGTFRPDRVLTAAEALTLCARVAALTYGLDSEAIENITSAWTEDLEELLGTSYSWFYDEAAVAMETGVLSWDDLSQRVGADALNAPLQKELLSVYLVRAMGLDSLAQSLTACTLDFADADSVTANYVPYVYLLSNCDVLTGDENKNFNPASAVNRAVSATMLSRVLNYIDIVGLKPELAEYTSYTWKAGTISQVTTGEGSAVVLTLINSLSGDKKITIPGTADIYKNDQIAAIADLKVGLYARACYDEEGDVFAVRLYDASKFTTVTGTVEDISQESVTISVNGREVSYAIDRFTEVAIGEISGDRKLIDADAGYTYATVQYSERNAAIAVQLRGGTRLVEGLIDSVSVQSGGGYNLQLTGFDGVTYSYNVDSDANITINGLEGSIKNSYVGSYAEVRVSNDDPSLVSTVQIDTLTRYIQGSIKSISYSRTPGSLTVTDLETKQSTIYSVPAETEICYNGANVGLKDLNVSDFVTIQLSGDDETLRVSAWPGTVEVSGELTGISYGTTTVLTVLQENGATMQFSLNMEDLPDIERNGADSTIARLIAGDQVTVTVTYQKITHIAATAQSANAVGTIETVTHAIGSSTLTVTLSDGATQTYTLGDNASITQDGKLVSRTALQPGYRLSMVVSGNEILAIEVEEAAVSTSKITGMVLYVDTSAKEILFQLDNGTPITVNVDSSTKFTTAATGGSLLLKNLKTGDVLTVYGEYNGGDFDATLVVRE